MEAAKESERDAARVSGLYRYPVKGLTPERMDEVQLEVGATFPFDRAYAIEAGSGKFDPLAPKHMAKINFLMLMRDEKLAALRTHFDPSDQSLTIFRDDRQVVKGQLTTSIGRSMIEQFFAGYLAGQARGAPKIVHADGHTFSDVAAHCVHIVNLETVRALERSAGRKIDPLRFRANIYVDGVPAWSEFSWLDRGISIGGATVKVWARTIRCDATNVDPATGQRDMAIPSLLQRTFGHQDVGVYARVSTAGAIKDGDAVAVLD